MNTLFRENTNHFINRWESVERGQKGYFIRIRLSGIQKFHVMV